MPALIALWNVARKLDKATLGAVIEIAQGLLQRDDRYSRARRFAEELAHERSTEELLGRMRKL